MLKRLAIKFLDFIRFKRSYAQNGEDIVLLSLFEKTCPKFYVDIGAHHPVRFSNTYLLHKSGWSGINIDAMPGSMDMFNIMRPNDINLEIGVGDQEGQAEFYIFNEPALNTFSKTVAETEANKNGRYRITQIKPVPIQPLRNILQQHAPKQKIGLLNVDVEGLDLIVLKSNNWRKWRPEFVIVEEWNFDASNPHKSQIFKFLTQQHYTLRASLKYSQIYQSNAQAITLPVKNRRAFIVSNTRGKAPKVQLAKTSR